MPIAFLCDCGRPDCHNILSVDSDDTVLNVILALRDSVNVWHEVVLDQSTLDGLIQHLRIARELVWPGSVGDLASQVATSIDEIRARGLTSVEPDPPVFVREGLAPGTIIETTEPGPASTPWRVGQRGRVVRKDGEPKSDDWREDHYLITWQQDSDFGSNYLTRGAFREVEDASGD